MDLQARLQKTYDDCIDAAEHPEKHTLVVRTWINAAGNVLRDLDTDERRVRRQRYIEVSSAFGVMGDKVGSYNDDSGYFNSGPLLKREEQPDELPDRNELPNRVQRGCAEGMIGMAACPLLNKPVGIFTMGGDTGIILKDAPPVFVSCDDAWSMYYENLDDIPRQELWDKKCMVTGEYSLKGTARAHSLMRDDPDVRAGMAGKLTILKTSVAKDEYPSSLKEVLDMQIPEGKSEMPPYLMLDPRSPEVLSKARDAYTRLVETLIADPDAMPQGNYAEVDVNAKLEHVAGIVVYNRGPDVPFVPEGKDPNWSTALQGRLRLITALYQACVEHEMLCAALGKDIKYMPTIIIHQPHSEDASMVHFPPTPNNKKIRDYPLYLSKRLC